MSLIVVPLDIVGDDPGGRAPILELATLVQLDREGRSSAAEGTRLAIVPFDPASWEGRDARRLVEGQVLHVPGPDAGPDDGSLAGRLGEAVDTALRQAAFVDGLSGAASLVVIVPVVVLPERADAEAQAAVDERLAAVREAIDGLATGDEGGDGAPRDFTYARFRYVPWVFSSGGLAGATAEAFRGPERIGASRAVPIVHGGRTRGDAPVPWEGYGETRLLVDLLFLGALSADRDAFRETLPQAPGSAERGALTLQSSLYEYPFDDLIRENVLRRLRSDHPQRGRLVPTVDELDRVLGRRDRDAIDESAQLLVQAVARVVEQEEVSADTFAFGTQRGDPGFGITPTAAALDAVGLARQADTLHTRFFAALERRSHDTLDAVIEKGLEAAHANTREETRRIEGALQHAFDHRTDGTSDGDADRRPASDTARAAARTLATTDALAAGLERLGESLQRSRPGDPADVIRDARALRSSWVEEEEKLLRLSERLPTVTGVVVHAAALALGAFFATWALLTFVGLVAHWGVGERVGVASLAAIASAGVFVWRRYVHLRRYEAKWHEVCDTMKDEADRLAARLAKIADHRVRLIKYSATTSLRRSLQGARRRFTIELDGFARMIDDEQAARSLRRRQQEEREAALPSAAIGRFPVAFEGRAAELEAAVDLDERAFHEQLETTVGDALQLRDMPRRVTLEEYARIVRGVVERASDRAERVAHLLQQDADQRLLEAIRHGADEQRLPKSQTARADDGPRRIAIVGDGVSRRLADASLRRFADAGVTSVASATVRAALPAGLAVVLTAQRLRLAEEARRG